MIRFDNVTMRYTSGEPALSELSFEIEGPELVFVSGHSGAGKSTLLKLIALVERPTRGAVLLQGTNVGRIHRRGVAAYRRRVGMIFQDHRLLPDASAFANVALPLLIAGVPRPERERRVRAALDRVGLLRRERALPVELSAGQQQRVGIARAIVNRPPVVLADEPTGNLDPELSAEIMNLFSELNASGMCFVIASHDLHLVRRMRRRVLVLESGRLIDDYRPPQAPADASGTPAA
ncbi:MAG: ATP-binding cassette domain-containing protein [Pseudomonadota bacterium]